MDLSGQLSNPSDEFGISSQESVEGSNNECLVALSGQLSNPSRPLLRMIRGESAQVTGGGVEERAPRVRQQQVHMSRQRQLELVARFQDGATQRALAEAYGCHRVTVAAILKRHGVETRRGLDEAGIQEAVRRYEAGESLATIGKALGVDPGTVRVRLVERGVRMRDTSGRER